MAYNSASSDLTAFFDHLVRCETRLYNTVGERLRAEHGIATSQFEFLRYLRDHPGARVVDIADNFAAGVGAISKGVDRLVEHGWARRHPNPEDGRSSLVSLTPDGARLLDDAESDFVERLAAVIDIPGDRLREVTTVLAALRSSLEQEGAGLPVG